MTSQLPTKASVVVVAVALVSTVLGTGCPSGDSSDPGDNNNNNGTDGDSDGNGDTVVSDLEGLVDGEGFFVGMDGIHDFSVLVPVDLTAKNNEDIYNVDHATYTPDDETVDQLADKLSTILNQSAWILKPFISGTKNVTRVTGVREGTADVKATPSFGVDLLVDPWDSQLTVIEYTPDQVAIGQKYYEDGQNACTSCHGGSENAPAHTLGLVLVTSDRKILDLLMNGAPFVSGTAVSYRHGFTFSSKDQQIGIAAYLRMIQEKDIAVLVETALEMDDLSMFGF